MTNLLKIGERLAWLRENSGYSQEALAEKLGCCAITISRWENGHTPMKVMDIVKIVDVLNVSADFFAGYRNIGRGFRLYGRLKSKTTRDSVAYLKSLI